MSIVLSSKAKKVAVLLAVLAAIIIGILILWPFQSAQQMSEPKAVLLNNEPQLGVQDTAEAVEIKPQASLTSVHFSTPKDHDQLLISSSLEGTNIDGALQANVHNELILNNDIRDFFDYFLSTADDVGIDVAIAEIQRYTNQYLPEPAKTDALKLLEGYLRFKQTEYQLQQTPITQDSLSDLGALALMRESFEILKTSRQNLFTKEQDQALFGLEDTYAEHTLATLELMADESLNQDQRNDGLAMLEAKLPPELSNSFAETRSDNKQAEMVEALVESSLDDSQVHSRLQAQGLSVDSANDVIARRQQQAEFSKNYQLYTQSLANLDQKQEGFQGQKQALIRQFFTSPEDQTQAQLRDLAQD